MPRIEAIIFDLYGTLVRLKDRLLHREVPRALGVERRRWHELLRSSLLTRAFPDRAAFVSFVCGALCPERPVEAAQRLHALLEQELASVEPVPGALSLLAFLKRRGYALGLVSNLSSVHKEPVASLGLAEHFAATAFSCDLGLTKPEPRIYLDLCARLGVEPGAALVVGDSLQNDVRVPRELGMGALRVGGDGAELASVADLGWMSLGPGAQFERLLASGAAVSLGGARGVLRDMQPLADAAQGRYNLVAAGRVEFEGGSGPGHASVLRVFCKRFLFPEAAHVEEFAHRLHEFLGMPSCHASVVAGSEPCLVVSEAPGRKLEEPVTPALAYEIGRHCALAYLFANADLRPRNAFVSFEGTRPTITMVDLEHCLFNLALDVSGIDEPKRPQSLDRLGERELRRRIQKRVLTEKTTRRTRRTFFETESLTSELALRFKDGWLDVYRSVRARADAVCDLIEKRIYQEPFLIIGTLAHRRAMARIDLVDFRERLLQDPEKVFVACF